jgi:hypothetical protein
MDERPNPFPTTSPEEPPVAMPTTRVMIATESPNGRIELKQSPASWQTTVTGSFAWVSAAIMLCGLLAKIDYNVEWYMWVPPVLMAVGGTLNAYFGQDAKPTPPPGAGPKIDSE